jgi:dTDP-4-dehydrorhamnose 3,5-epimerase
VHEPIRHKDNRGHFEEKFKLSSIERDLGRTFSVRQVNQSVSNKGVVRGIHWTIGSSGQAKYISCPEGILWDVVVDVRPESETFLRWEAVLLTPENGRSVLISEGLGHAFMSLQDGTVANYLCSAEFDPTKDLSANPLEPAFGVSFLEIAKKYGIEELLISEKDLATPAFVQTRP